VFLWRWFISPLFPSTCIYTPSCSHYAAEAILRHGAVKGSALGAARLFRCTGRFFDGGYDPVPETFSFEEIKAGYRTHSLRRRRREAGRPGGADAPDAAPGKTNVRLDEAHDAEKGDGRG
jgi:putative membrane protein insertion efficiency factor